MTFEAYISRHKTLLLDVCFTLLVVVLSFPKFEPDFNIGLDATFRWAYNYLFAFDYDALISLRYTYGPLAFLKVPVAIGNNFLIAITVFIVLKGYFCYLLLDVGKKNINYFSYLLVLVVAYFVTIDQAIIGLVALFSFRYYDNTILFNFVGAFLMALLGFYVKPQIGLNCFAILIMLVLLIGIRNFNGKQLLKLLLLSLILVITSSIVVGHHVFYFFKLFYASLKISSGYSSSLSLFPSNNWFLLTLFILSVLGLPLLIKRNYLNRFLILLPVFFFTWKYGMVREEFLYYKRMIDTVVVCWGLLVLNSHFKHYVFYLVSILSIALLLLNLNTINTEKKVYQKEWFGWGNFGEAFFDQADLEEKSIQLSAKNIHVNRLPSNIRAEIGSNSIDFYPWDMSFAPANNLNWTPRKTFQSLGISNWVDLNGASSFTLENGPQFVLFHYVHDSMGGQLGGIDYRYLLNMEPETNNVLLSNYDILSASDNWALFKQKIESNLTSSVTIKQETMDWNTWYDCPNDPKAIVKLKTKITSTALGSLMEMVYKSTEYIVDYELESGAIKSYRFIPSAAKNGLWVSPFLDNFNSGKVPLNTKRIRFRVKDQSYTKAHFQVSWEVLNPTNQNTLYFLN